VSRLIVFDVSSFIFRAYFAIRPLSSPDGTPVNAVYGVLNMIQKILKDYKPTHVLIARDTKEKSFRLEIYPEYKANRSEPPEDLRPQFKLIEELVDLLNWPQLKMVGYEADDIIGSIVTQMHSEFDEILIATGDKDLMQFVDDKVKMLDSMKDKIYGVNDVKEKMGVWPNQIVDYLSLIGDSSDNIPGVKGIGEKGAQKLLEEYENLETCLLKANEVANKRTREALLNGEESAHLSKKLVSIVTDLKLGLAKNNLELHFHASDALVEFLINLGFQTSVQKLKDFMRSEHSIRQSTDVSLQELSFADFAQKYETYVGQFYLDLIEGRSHFAVHVDGQNFVFKYDDADVTSLLKMIAANAKNHLLAWDIKPLMKKMLKMNISFQCDYDDLSLLHFIIDPSLKHTLEFATQEYQGVLLHAEPDTEPKFAQRAQAVQNLFVALMQKIEELKMLKVYQEIEKPLIPILAQMEHLGVMIDLKFFDNLDADFSQKLEYIENEIEQLAGSKINLRSPKQLSHLLFEELKLPIIKKTKTGASTDSEVLQELAEQEAHPIIEHILSYRELDKLLSTYIKAFPKLVDLKNNRLHTTYQQTNAATGRLSSDHPNLQNIPVRTENGRLLRKGFIAAPEKIFVSADYSQVELRILAHCSQDPVMLKSFQEGIDIHTQTAAEIFGLNIKDVTKDQRNSAKAINFGLMYGQSSFGLSKNLGITRGQAKDYITFYFERFSHVKNYLDSLREFCERHGYVETLFGRKRFLPDIHSKNRTVKAMAERIAINSPIQGTAADIIKIAMNRIDARIRRENLNSRLILQVHDELIVESTPAEANHMTKILVEEMEGSAQLSLPLKVEVGMGANWFDLK